MVEKSSLSERTFLVFCAGNLCAEVRNETAIAVATFRVFEKKRDGDGWIIDGTTFEVALADQKAKELICKYQPGRPALLSIGPPKNPDLPVSSAVSKIIFMEETGYLPQVPDLINPFTDDDGRVIVDLHTMAGLMSGEIKTPLRVHILVTTLPPHLHLKTIRRFTEE